MLFECMGICVLSPAHESEMRGYHLYLLIVKPQYFRLDGLLVFFLFFLFGGDRDRGGGGS